MKKIVLAFAAAPVLLFAAGCNNSASTDIQSTNAAAQQPPPAMNATPPGGAGMSNAVPSVVMNTNSTGMDTNNPAATNTMNTATNMTPP